jgi:hypothetical protein
MFVEQVSGEPQVLIQHINSAKFRISSVLQKPLYFKK